MHKMMSRPKTEDRRPKTKRLTFIFILAALYLLLSTSWTLAQDEDDFVLLKELSIEEVSQLALEKNIDIQIAKFDAYIKRYDLDKEESIFDTILNLEASYENDQKKTASTLGGTKSIEHKFGVSLEKRLPSGTDIELETSLERDWTNSAWASVNPAYEATVKLTLIQDIGKNFFGLIDRSKIKITKLDIESSDWTSLDDIEMSLAATQKSYWNLALKEEELKIRKEMLKEAEKLDQLYKEKFNLGLAEEPDFLATRANLKLRRNELLVAQLNRETAKNDLLFLLNEDNTAIDIKVKNTLATLSLRAELYAELRNAINNRRDYKRAKNNVKSKKIDIVIKENSLWPEIDLKASYARNGLSSSYSNSWGDVTSEDNPEVFLGITISVPLENRNAKADYAKAKLEKEKYILKLKRVERLILKELNNQVTSVNTLAEKAEAYKEVVELQDKKLKAEYKRFNQGRSSSDLIIRYENDLLNAKLSLAQALFDYHTNLIGLDLAKNSLLDKYWKDEL